MSEQTPPMITPGMISHLSGTRPWVRFLSILGFIGTGFMVLIGIGMTLFGAFLPDWNLAGAIAAGLVYLVMAGIYLAVTLRLHGYAGAIRALEAAGSVQAMERALEEQMRFWRLTGIIAAVMMVIYALMLGLLLIVALVGGLASLM